ncbi:MAG: hypothetical protein ACJAVR_000250 [Paracoccaceae bacterium]|jgi:hypothetical protein
MTTFDNRENAFENKYAHDAEMQFKAQARRDKLLGLWVAGLMGISGEEADTYARSVVIADLEEAGDEDVYRKVSADMTAKGIAIDALRAKMDEFLAVAKTQILTEIQ